MLKTSTLLNRLSTSLNLQGLAVVLVLDEQVGMEDIIFPEKILKFIK